MESMPLPAPEASSTALETAVTPANLLAAFAAVADPRRAASVSYPLAAVLALATVAIMAGHLSPLAMAEWGKRQAAPLLARMGFVGRRTPCQSTLQRLFAKLNGAQLSAALSAAFAPVAAAPPSGAKQAVAIDGKAQRGRLQYEGARTPIHSLTAFVQQEGIVLAQEEIHSDSEKREAELSVAPTLVARLDWHDRVLTGDALLCQRGLCQQVLDAGGDYLLRVKANQPHLLASISLLFDPPAALASVPLSDRRAARTQENGHGRHNEVRQLQASTDLNAYLDWPGVGQVFRVERSWDAKRAAHRQVRYGISSLTPAQAGAAALLQYQRGHWQIENQLHWQKDVVLREDASLVHVGQGPQVLAILRDTAVSLLRHAGHRKLAASLRQYSQFPDAAVALLLQPLSTRA